jgi:hypothetical protein
MYCHPVGSIEAFQISGLDGSNSGIPANENTRKKTMKRLIMELACHSWELSIYRDIILEWPKRFYILDLGSNLGIARGD